MYRHCNTSPLWSFTGAVTGGTAHVHPGQPVFHRQYQPKNGTTSRQVLSVKNVMEVDLESLQLKKSTHI